MLSQNQISESSRNEKGQMSIFFSVTMILLITCMAFIINVGMFVKAKINLQNAVDAAAFSGAAVLARQLSNISYINWEMRNVYKEWMFKFYVLGQSAHPKTNPDDARYARSGPKIDFRISRFDPADTTGDFFNIPSTCIHHAGARVNICAIYSLPGLPRFSPLGLVGIDETHNEFMNAIVKEKANDCTKRAELNFMTNLHWVYGTNVYQLEGTPEIASDRTGAWPIAFEMAVRIRNLEKIVNDPPAQSPLCTSGSSCTPIASLHQQPGELPIHERSVKAFWSAYRNLENNDTQENLKRTFKLYELAPTEVNVSDTSLSGVLIPDGSTKKYYLDLRLALVNYVNFYSLFSASTANVGGNSPQSEAACDSIKVGLPVPGYPMGYDKNPEVLTYYAVKGEAEYTGLFNPFANSSKMVAYAAAKPFGGRVGPMLFLMSKNFPSEVRARVGAKRSYSYISGLKPNTPTSSFKRGFPMPISSNFWTSIGSASSGTLGGYPTNNTKYGIPNLIYDIVGDLNDQNGGVKAIQEINDTDDRSNNVIEDSGLYLKNQFALLKSNMQNTTGGPITGNLIRDAIERVRAPTLYDAANYLIPTQDLQEPNDAMASSPAVISISGFGANIGTPYQLLAPLFGEGTFFPERNNIIGVFEKFIILNQVSIETYLQALHDISKDIVQQSVSATTNTDLGADRENYTQAAKNIHDSPGGSWNTLTCNSIAGKFAGFFLGASFGFTECPDRTGRRYNIKKSIMDFWDAEVTKNSDYRTHFRGVYVNPFNRSSASTGGLPTLNPEPTRGKNLMTGYLPGLEYGADANGVFPHPFGGTGNITASFKTERNYYSTKFVALQTLSDKKNITTPYIEGGVGGFTTYSEGSNKAPVDISIDTFTNKIDTRFLSEDIKNIME